VGGSGRSGPAPARSAYCTTKASSRSSSPTTTTREPLGPTGAGAADSAAADGLGSMSAAVARARLPGESRRRDDGGAAAASAAVTSSGESDPSRRLAGEALARVGEARGGFRGDGDGLRRVGDRVGRCGEEATIKEVVQVVVG